MAFPLISISDNCLASVCTEEVGFDVILGSVLSIVDKPGTLETPRSGLLSYAGSVVLIWTHRCGARPDGWVVVEVKIREFNLDSLCSRVEPRDPKLISKKGAL